MTKKLLTVALAVAVAASPLMPLVGSSPAAAVGCTVTVRLTPGVNNPAVRCLEQRLLELRYRSGAADTAYDQSSVNAVKLFQRQRGLYPDGIVTSITGRQLGLRGALPAPGTTKVTVLGDSTSAAMRWYDEARNETAIYDIMGTAYDLQWSIESCRRLAAASCVGRTDPGTGGKWTPISVLPEMRGALKGRLGDAVVVMAGYDDYPSIAGAIDAIVAEAESQGVSRVFWLTYRTTGAYRYGTYYAQHNAALAAARVRHPNLVLLDWNGYTHRQTAATQDVWFEADNIHMTRSGGVALARFVKSSVDASSVRSCTAARATNGSAAAAPGRPPTPDPAVTGLFPTNTTRVFDSRPTKLGKGREVSIDLTPNGVPVGAPSAALSVTAIDPCNAGYLTVHACGARPNVVTLAFEGGRTSTGAVIAPLSAGRVCVYSSVATDVVVELNGWFAVGGDVLHRTGPTRLLSAIGGTSLAPNSQTTIDLAGKVPAGTTALWVNVGVVSAGTNVGLFLYPGACRAAPVGATVTAFAGRGAWSTTIVPVVDGKVCLRASSSGRMHAIVDMWGWFDADTAGGLGHRALPPSTLYGNTVAANTAASIVAANVPVLNVTTVSGTGGLSLQTCGGPTTRPLLQEVRGEFVSNLGLVAASAKGQVCVVSVTAAKVIVVRTGEFVSVPA
jgi:peptidoglycan hydrolase-like protein with peptidoglycan-binding domain